MPRNSAHTFACSFVLDVGCATALAEFDLIIKKASLLYLMINYRQHAGLTFIKNVELCLLYAAKYMMHPRGIHRNSIYISQLDPLYTHIHHIRRQILKQAKNKQTASDQTNHTHIHTHNIQCIHTCIYNYIPTYKSTYLLTYRNEHALLQ